MSEITHNTLRKAFHYKPLHQVNLAILTGDKLKEKPELLLPSVWVEHLKESLDWHIKQCFGILKIF